MDWILSSKFQKHATSKNGIMRPLSLLLSELWPIYLFQDFPTRILGGEFFKAFLCWILSNNFFEVFLCGIFDTNTI